ncbi:MAG: tRNA (cytidine(34)-2'-O)-methyltransferase [Defluviitaleaceae bacterium]|nr:tRNA (cytidine(34)-2'-O)-methyltransferase [Defluviitaleaceae bacterium]
MLRSEGAWGVTLIRMNIVLFEPEIPHNTGAIGRTCLMTGARLHLIHPLGFFLDEKSLKRAGMDYWKHIDVWEYDNFDHFMAKYPTARFFLVETGGAKTYAEVHFLMDDFLIFGSESKGLPAWVIEKYYNHIITIPMKGAERSLNLSVSVGIVLYEALRQNNFGSFILPALGDNIIVP